MQQKQVDIAGSEWHGLRTPDLWKSLGSQKRTG
jgi:hypothetical protein